VVFEQLACGEGERGWYRQTKINIKNRNTQYCIGVNGNGKRNSRLVFLLLGESNILLPLQRKDFIACRRILL
jgi:hypothetical protein